MAEHELTPVFTGLRIGLHTLTAVLLGVVVVGALTDLDGRGLATLAAATVFAVVYLLGGQVARMPAQRRHRATVVWLTGLTLVWLCLLVLSPEAAYLVFPLFFLYLHVLPGPAGAAAVVAVVVVAIIGLGWRDGFTVGGVVGPLVGAGVALLIGLGYRALEREAVERERLVAELIATRDRLAATEREQGMLAERSRLAREIHDTVAQGLSSIQMLLHATERAAPDHPGNEHIRLARETAAANLADTRRFIRELAPPSLDEGLPSALRRLAESHRARTGLVIDLDVPERVELPMDLQTSLLRIVQGALANVDQHARATHATVALEAGEVVTLEITDDGVGFDPSSLATDGGTDSFGLRAIGERVDQLGGVLLLDSTPGAGTTLRVTLPLDGGLS